MRSLVLFVKHPCPGRVKTRLAVELGDALATGIYAAFTADLIERFRRTADHRRLAFDPDSDESRRHFESLAAGRYVLWPQPQAGLGERLVAAFDAAFAAGASRVVVLGSDSPLLPAAFIDRAFTTLEHRDCVLGPATDGGYYLVGLRRPLPALFEQIDWSGPRVLTQTIARHGGVSGATLGLLPPWYDVDTLDDLVTLRGHVRALRAAGEPVDLPTLEPLLDAPAIDAAIAARDDL